MKYTEKRTKWELYCNGRHDKVRAGLSFFFLRQGKALVSGQDKVIESDRFRHIAMEITKQLLIMAKC